MRQIKFKAWSKNKKKICDIVAIDFLVEKSVNLHFTELKRINGDWEKKDFNGKELLEDVIFLQFTGLKDKNGMEIYEGDIVNTDEFNFGKGEVWFSEQGMWLFGDKEKKIGEVFMDSSHYEIIGNIFENKDLIN